MSGLSGLLVFLLLHLLFVVQWSWFSASPWPGYEAATERGIVEPWFVHTPRSLWVTRVALALVASFASYGRKGRRLPHAIALWLGASLGVVFTYATTNLPALDWGWLGYLVYPLRIALPVIAGTLAGAWLARIVRQRTTVPD